MTMSRLFTLRKFKDDQHLQGDAGRVEKSAVGRGHYTGCWTSPLGGVPRARCYVSAMTSEGSSGLAEARRRHAGQGLGRPDRPRVERARCMTHLQRVKGIIYYNYYIIITYSIIVHLIYFNILSYLESFISKCFRQTCVTEGSLSSLSSSCSRTLHG